MDKNKKIEDLENEIESLMDELDLLENTIPVNNMGKWYLSVRKESVSKKIESLKNKLLKLKTND